MRIYHWREGMTLDGPDYHCVGPTVEFWRPISVIAVREDLDSGSGSIG